MGSKTWMHIPCFDINHHLYADDTQIYMSSVSNAKESLEMLQHCLIGVPA